MKFLRLFVPAIAFVGILGWTPAALAAREPGGPEAKDLILKGDHKCTGCHDESDEPLPTMLELHPGVLAIGKTHHGTKADGKTPTCTDCHGESEKHLSYKGKDKPPKPDRYFARNSLTPIEERNDACLKCHQQDAKRSHWAGSPHDQAAVACTSCHQMHTANDKVRDKRTQAEVCFTCHKEQRAQVNKPSHHPIPEGKMGCSDCHNAHGSAGPKLMARDSVNNTCYTCHMEKRGPFVHNHEPVNEDCGNCHNPHGTTNENLLKVRAPFLCHQCHTPHGGFIPQLRGAQVTVNGGGQVVPFTPAAAGVGKATTNVTQGRACLNCHTQVHGSNNPAFTDPTPQFNLR